ncbi:MAG: HAMP domain-containing histidine kinase [Ignavibacteriaceae bacterium]|nr:HAMP domain-containing histidine kinase [Ignavibacteriaceae bacterium]
MNFLEFNKYRVTESEKPELEKFFRQLNASRSVLATGLVIPFFVFLTIIVFVFVEADSDKLLLWKNGILFTHIFSAIYFSTLFIIFMLYRKGKIQSDKMIDIFVSSLFIIVPMIGVALSAFDQLITTSIIPFFISCTIIPLIFLHQPLKTTFFYIIIFLVFVVAQSEFQKDEYILTSNFINGLTAIVISIFVSSIIWRLNLNQFRKDRVISNQQKLLHEKNQELKLYAEELKTNLQTRDKFFSIISHDLRSPFQGFLGLTSNLAHYYQSFSEEEITTISAELNKEANNLYKLISNLLEWARMQQGAVTFNPEEFNLCKLIDSNVEMFLRGANNKEISLKNLCDKEISVFADLKMIDSVIRNLISNAIKFTNRGGTITIIVNKIEDKYVQVSVVDNGIGISKENIEKLFRIDVKVRETGTEGESSTGLGLLLCKEFVEKNNGKITVESEEGKGSKFSFTLPVVSL